MRSGGAAAWSLLHMRRSFVCQLTMLICLLRLPAHATPCSSSTQTADDCNAENPVGSTMLLAVSRGGLHKKQLTEISHASVAQITPETSNFPGDSSSEPVINFARGDVNLLGSSVAECEDKSRWCDYFKNQGACRAGYTYSGEPIQTHWCPVTCEACDLLGRDEMDVLLKRHNAYRRAHGVTDLTWDDALASQSQQWADMCNPSHSHYDAGENLWMGTGSLNGESATDAWYNEITAYDFNNPGFSSGTGHFTQVVWKDSTKIGCGFKKCGTLGRMTNANFLVCEYLPRGNNVGPGFFAANVLPRR
jgi:hypothetical protein